MCVHQFFDEEIFSDIYKSEKKGLIEIIHSKNIDLMDEFVKSKLLITDYSSVGYDFTFLNRPVLLYQSDLDIYNKTRGFYCDFNELNENNITDDKILVDTIIHENYYINPFFRKIFPDVIDYEYVKSSRNILNLYDYLVEIQRNKLTILGLNFYEHSNVVSSTMKLAENLLKLDYLVEVVSIFHSKRKFALPFGLNCKELKNYSNFKERRFNFWDNKKNSYLKYEYNNDRFNPGTSKCIEKFIKDINSKTIISTTFSTNLFLDDCSLAKLQTVRIVHGKGTGKLKSGIHTFLKTNPHVKNFRMGTFGEGEMGVTVVELK